MKNDDNVAQKPAPESADPDTVALVMQQVGPPAALTADAQSDEIQQTAQSGDSPAISPARPRGRPRKLDQPQREKVLLLLSVGLNRRQAAAYVGCRPNALSQAARRDPHFAAEMERAEVLFEADLSLRLLRAGRRTFAGAKWLFNNCRPFSSRVADCREDAALFNLKVKHRNDEDPYDDGEQDDEDEAIEAAAPDPPQLNYYSYPPHEQSGHEVE